MSDSYNFPRSMWELLDKHVGQCKNLALILDKYPPDDVPGNSQGKSEWLKRLEPNGHIDTALTQSAYARWRAMISAMGVIPFHTALDWRMVIGLGGESVLETDLTLHHLYGIPFIPGSALKGLTRTYVTGEIEGYKSDKIDNDNEEVKRLFGSQKQAGTVLFFDAMPLNGEVKFVVDIMNPHYPEYYNSLKSSKTTPPTNDQQPNPITFLTVTNTTFTFALALRNPNDLEHKDDLNKTKGWLQEALQKYGVGGKTSAGYGYFRKVDDKDTVPASPASVQTIQRPQPLTAQENWQRPNIPRFREGQEIQQCFVTQPTDTMRRYYPAAGAFLRYRELPIAVAYIVIEEALPEGQQWQLKDSTTCIFAREEQREGCLVLVCKAKPPKDRKK
jgi:CRISPR-associated protein Cmr6